MSHPDTGVGMMSSVGSTPERDAQLEGTFGPHLEAVCERSARALTACGYAGLLVHSGSLLGVCEDDRTYPFEANAPFKVWVPLQDAADCFVWFEPGSAPRLIIHRSGDYWHKSADVPQAYWSRHFEVRTATDRAGGTAQPPAGPPPPARRSHMCWPRRLLGLIGGWRPGARGPGSMGPGPR